MSIFISLKLLARNESRDYADSGQLLSDDDGYYKCACLTRTHASACLSEYSHGSYDGR